MPIVQKDAQNTLCPKGMLLVLRESQVLSGKMFGAHNNTTKS